MKVYRNKDARGTPRWSSRRPRAFSGRRAAPSEAAPAPAQWPAIFRPPGCGLCAVEIRSPRTVRPTARSSLRSACPDGTMARTVHIGEVASAKNNIRLTTATIDNGEPPPRRDQCTARINALPAPRAAPSRRSLAIASPWRGRPSFCRA